MSASQGFFAHSLSIECNSRARSLPPPIDASWRLWFHHPVHLQLKSSVLATTVVAVLLLCASISVAQPGVELSPGESVVDFAWADRANLTLLVRLGDAYALRRMDLANDEISVIPVPNSFSQIDSKDSGLVASISPQGNAVAFLDEADDPGSRDRPTPGSRKTLTEALGNIPTRQTASPLRSSPQ